MAKKRTQRNWTDAEEHFIEQNYGKLTTKEIAEALDRPLRPTRAKISHMGFRKGIAKKGKHRAKRCPRCETDNRLGNKKCFKCGLKLHTLASCRECAEQDGKRCLAFMDPRDPLLNLDGSCKGRKTISWVDVK